MAKRSLDLATTKCTDREVIGKAREIYSALPVERSTQYEDVRQAILKAYELVPEAYRQKFRNCKKQESQTYVEFAREKEALFDRWCSAKQVDKDYNKLRQLILLEEFKKCLQSDVKMYIDEQKADGLHQAAILADDYSLTHKNSFLRADQQTPSFFTPEENPKREEQKHIPPPVMRGRNNGQGRSRPDNLPKSVGGPVCYYCKRRGHVMAECRVLEKKNNSHASNVFITSKKQSSVVEQLSVKKDQYNPFILKGYVSLSENGDKVPVNILRDTGATQSLLVEGILPLSDTTATGTTVQIQGIGLGVMSVPLHVVYLSSDLITGTFTVGIRPTLPIKGISLILGNDLAGSKVMPDLQLVSDPELTEEVSASETSIFPACAVTRAAAKRAHVNQEQMDQTPVSTSTTNTSAICDPATIPQISQATTEDGSTKPCPSMSREQLIHEQQRDTELSQLVKEAVSEEEMTEHAYCYYIKSGVLMRKWRPPDAPATEEWQVTHQIVLPKCCRQEVMSLAHELPVSGHLGVNKTYHKVMSHFFWPRMKRDVAKFCKTCHICQLVGKPNKPIPVAPLKPIPACGEPFSEVIIDCVGPLPKTKTGNKYLLTIMCKATRFPEAVPLRNIKAPKIVDSLIKFFTFVGLPRSVQSDQGSNFMSGLMQQAMYQLGVKQCKSSAYHPESQGALERFHQTLKNMIRAYCTEYNNDWDQGIHLLLFAAREAIQESLGFSPFELVFGRTVRGPLKLLKEMWLAEDTPDNLLDQVADLRYRLIRANDMAKKNLEKSQTKMKTWYDKKAKKRSLKIGYLLDKTRYLLCSQYLNNHYKQGTVDHIG